MVLGSAALLQNLVDVADCCVEVLVLHRPLHHSLLVLNTFQEFEVVGVGLVIRVYLHGFVEHLLRFLQKIRSKQYLQVSN